MTNIGDSINSQNAGFKFQGEVCKNFETHVQKSIPLYKEGHDLICKVSDFFLQDGSLCYDLGCSTGTLMQKLSKHNQHKNIQFIGIDSQNEMICQAQEKNPNLTFQWENLKSLELKKSDLIICYYTLQFVPPKYRQEIFNKIYAALNWGGGFVLFEKVRGPDARFQDMFTSLYYDFKLDQGYNGEEILAKTRSLKGVLEPFSTQANIDLMKRSGFSDVTSVLKYVCFEGFLAIK